MEDFLQFGNTENSNSTTRWWKCNLHDDPTKTQFQCTKSILTVREEGAEVIEGETTRQTTTAAATNSSRMGSSSFSSNFRTVSVFVCILFLFFSVCCPAHSLHDSHNSNHTTTLRPEEELQKLRLIRAHLKKINKPPVKTIQSADGDLIDCVLSHQQPAFDHPKLIGQKPMDPPERPKGRDPTGILSEDFQLWSMSGESCPEGTVPIRRTSEQDMLRASNLRRFARKLRRPIRRDSTSNGHEHAVGYVTGDQYYGAKASINVWAPKVVTQYEFSLSQIWVIAGSFNDDLNTIEAGWQVSPELYGDNYPRFFTYWTSDAYQATGCYNLLCSGFVQTNNKIAIGAAISPTSAYNGGQFDISLLIWKVRNFLFFFWFTPLD
ncbi:OLC1v1028364C1 [Oldenlandia corymbosa var. corymbosa]|uniref:OLC1v1028364C1 n=1 Tax=Oldenlandia corymbosa var. corymbosa TaxID=529605 RepID=A0AAV1CDE8_OLDCO|nr:OLC1v1028364C1 [Oldenlandia corymbosa var. corymbosa]